VKAVAEKANILFPGLYDESNYGMKAATIPGSPAVATSQGHVSKA